MLFEGSASGSTRARTPEFLAVVLCGLGQDLFPLTGVGGSSAKATLPVANRPIVDHVLSWAEQSGLTKALVLAPEAQKAQIASTLRSRRTEAKDPIQTDLECLDDDDFLAQGTAGTLREAARRGLIRTSFVVLPCDLFFATGPTTEKRSLSRLLDRHRVDRNLITSLFFERGATGLDPKEAPALVLTSTDPRTGTLLDLQDLDDLGSDIDVRTSMLKRFPATVLSTSLLPAHVFVCSKRVVALLAAFPTLDSFKDDFVPWLAKAQWQRGLLEKTAEPGSDLAACPDPQTHALSRSTTNPHSIPSDPPPAEEPPVHHSRPPIRPLTSTFAGLSFLDAYPPHSMPPSRPESALSSRDPPNRAAEPADAPGGPETETACVAVVWRKAGGFCARGNSLASYSEMNRIALKAHAAKGGQQAASAQLSADSIVGPNVVIGERASVKRTCVGKGSSIGRNSRVNGCVLMENAVVGESVKLDNCIVCAGARIGDRAQLKDCQVSADYFVEPEANAKGEQYVPMQLE